MTGNETRHDYRRGQVESRQGRKDNSDGENDSSKVASQGHRSRHRPTVDDSWAPVGL